MRCFFKHVYGIIFLKQSLVPKVSTVLRRKLNPITEDLTIPSDVSSSELQVAHWGPCKKSPNTWQRSLICFLSSKIKSKPDKELKKAPFSSVQTENAKFLLPEPPNTAKFSTRNKHLFHCRSPRVPLLPSPSFFPSKPSSKKNSTKHQTKTPKISLFFPHLLQGIALERKPSKDLSTGATGATGSHVPPSPSGRRSVLANIPPSPTTSVTSEPGGGDLTQGLTPSNVLFGWFMVVFWIGLWLFWVGFPTKID